MGVLTDYFAAGSDEAAALYIDHGPAHGGLSGDEEIAAAFHAARQSGDRQALHAVFRARLQTAVDGTLVVRSKGILPDVPLDTLESLLTGAPYDDIATGPRSAALLASRNDHHVQVLTVTDELQSALAAADQDRLAEVATAWSQTDELYGDSDPADLTYFLTALSHLGREATARNQRLYCWVCV